MTPFSNAVTPGHAASAALPRDRTKPANAAEAACPVRLAGIALIFASVLSSACAVGPKYQRPATPAVPSFKELAGDDQWKTATPSDAQLKGNWWEIFGDPQLNNLEEMISVNNFS